MIRIPRIVVYGKNLRYLAQCFRSFSSEHSSQSAISCIKQNSSQEGSITSRKHNEREIYLFGPEDMRAPLPGNIGVATSSLFTNDDIMLSAKPNKQDCDILTVELPEDRHRNVITHLLTFADRYETEDMPTSAFSMHLSNNLLECVAQECPQLLRRDFADLFPGRDINQGNLTVITLCQKTNNSMDIWSEETELEREHLMDCFVKAAEDICALLNDRGYWADFIDPSSGRPYLGPYTNATMFETDERYRHFGFTIEDLGCCKVTRHHLWGTHSFVGCLFTNAPLNSPEICEILTKHKSKNIHSEILN
uniref:Methylmalonic aciduria and homocystinuria type D homolog, mitochondrial n=1 Tax=Hadrurus spadix TaxID=141984 RepID=A0A1W7RA74_9SCOR